MTPDNKITNRMVDNGQLPKSQRENVPQNETVAQTFARGQETLSRLTGSISANDLATPPQQAPITPVVPPQLPEQNAGVVNNVLGSIQSTSENAQRLAEERAAFQSFAEGSSGFDIQNEQLERFGVTPDKLARLEDIQLQLNTANTASGVQQERIKGAGGQTLGQAGREVTQEQRENAVRNSGLAAEAAILQGNIQAGRALAKDAVDIAMQDRTFQANAQLQAIDDLKEVVDEETRQLLVKEERKYTEELNQMERVKTAVDNAVVSGAATASEMALLTDPNISDEERFDVASDIQARAAKEMRDLQIQEAGLNLAIKSEQLADLRTPTIATRPTSLIEVNGVKKLIDTQTGEEIATFGQEETTDEIVRARETAFTNNIDILKTHPGLNSSVGPIALARTAVGDKFGNKDEFIGSVENVVKNLTLNTFADAKEQGLTFGAMSQGEWDILAQSASKIAQWRQYEKEGIIGFRKETDRVAGYDVSESAFKKELDTLSNFAKMDALRKGASPEEIGVQQTEDGKMWAQNSDGTFTELTISPQI